MKKSIQLISLSILIPILLSSQTASFSGDSVYNYVEHLSEKIGPRPMGSPNERIALNWAREKFQSFGADSAFTLWFEQTKVRGRPVNTQSGVSVGIFKGKTDSSIVIGGHIDSAGEELPGANDDGSGASTAMELARIWAQRERNYTMIFCTFGGEESGLVGSTYFTENFTGMDRVFLMISTDMAGSDKDITMLIESDSVMAPKWLVEKSFKIAEERGYDELTYFTHFGTINHIGGGGAGSDHMPFLEKGIPAIDFTAGINDFPIHTPQDQLQFMSTSMFQNYGDFVDALIMNFQENGIPQEKTGKFFLWHIMGLALYIPYSLITIFNIIALLFGIAAFVHARKQRHQIPKEERIRWSGWKLFLFLVIIAIFTQLGEALIQIVQGMRYPWITAINAYLWYALIWTIGGIWVVLQIARKWKFINDPYSYALRSFIMLYVVVLLFSFAGMRQALYPATALFLFSIAVFVKQPLLKTLFAFLSIMPTFSLLIHEAFDFFARMMTNSGFAITNLGVSLAFSALMTVLLVIFFLPYVYVFSYAVVTNKTLKNNLKIIANPLYGLALLLVIIGYGLYLANLPVYNDMWRPTIEVRAEYDLHKAESDLEVVGNEFFKDMQVKTDSLVGTYDGCENRLEVPYGFAQSWMTFSGGQELRNGEMDTVSFNWNILSPRRWMRATVNVVADTGHIIEPESNYAFFNKDSLLQYNWVGGYRDSLQIEGKFLVTPGTKLIRTITTRYPDVPSDILVSSELANIRKRTVMRFKDTLRISAN